MTAALRKLRARTRGDAEGGFTLAEMLVAVLLFGVLGTFMTTWFISTYTSARKTTGRTDDYLAVQSAMSRLTQDLQFAIAGPTTEGPFVTAGSDNITFYSKLNGLDTASLVVWQLSSGSGTYNATLTRTVTPPTGSGSTATYPAASAKTQTMLKGLNDVNTAKSPAIFRYLDALNAQYADMCLDSSLTATATAVPSATPTAVGSDGEICARPLGGDPLSVSDAGDVVAVEVLLTVATTGDGALSANPPYESSNYSGIPTTLRSRIYPLNAGYTA